MKSTTSLLSTLLTLLLARTTFAQYSIQSKPFQLVIISSNATLNGSILDACHEGAAIEGLCVAPKTTSREYTTYHLNISANEFVANPQFGKTGVLTWVLPASNINVSEAMQFFIDPSTNVALPLFEPSEEYTLVAFDTQNRLNYQSYLDDTTTPPSAETVRALYRWYVCESDFEGYLYQTLNWVLGKYPPENPSCQKVTVVRRFE